MIQRSGIDLLIKDSILFKYCPKAGKLDIEGAVHTEWEFEKYYNYLGNISLKIR
ncbi:MAG: hypothetical protein AB8U25_00165 [Rickettsiales endosymbiont of Dermacentor nuttalli]